METTIKLDSTNGQEIKIKSTFLGSKPAKWDDRNWNNHIIHVKFNGKTTKFDFWGSLAKPKIEDEEKLIFALYCFISDAVAAEESFEDFCANFGYDNDSIKALKTYKACETANTKFNRVFDGVDIYDMLNEIQEKHNC